MPRLAGIVSTKRPEYRALEIMKLNKAVTPTDINKHVGTGDYASKYISFLKRDGYEITVTKDGRAVVSYTLTKALDKEPAHAMLKVKDAKVAKPKAKKSSKKAVKATKAPAKAKTVIKVKAVDVNAPLPAKKVVSKAAAKKKAKDKPVMDMNEEPIVAEFEPENGLGGIDGGFDSMDDIDPSELA